MDQSRNVTLENLRPGKEHQIWIVTRTTSPKVTESPHLSVTTFQQLNLVTVTKKTPRSLQVTWQAPDTHQAQAHRLVYYPKEAPAKRNFTEIKITQPRQKYVYDLEKLIPGTDYVLKVSVVYLINLGLQGNMTTNFTWPQDDLTIVS